MTMQGSNPTVLVVGAAGRFAGLVVPELASRGVKVRALVRNDEKATTARRHGASEIALGDLRDIESLEAAAREVDGVFHIGPAFVADEAELGSRMVDVARRAGVRQFVFSSVIHPTNISLKNHASKVPVEDAIFRSGMQYTILHPAAFFQNIAAGWRDAREHGVFAEPYPSSATIARVDYRDVAEVAAMAFTGDRLAYGTFELCAVMTNREQIVALMSGVLGRRIAAGELSFEQWAAKAELAYDEQQLQMFAKVFDHYAAHGTGGNSLALRAILGREPRTLRRFVEELAVQS
jgi:uncharacterized protein YbjT (DUF2867 family)